MLHIILSWAVDLIAFGVLAIVAAFILNRWARRLTGKGLSRRVWIVFAGILVAGISVSWDFGEREKHRLQDTVSGLAPTYAQEMGLMGHASITPNTPADDPTYLRLIDAELRWQKANATISDIYTFGRTPQGKIVLLVDSETDYNHNGQFDGEKEQRTAIGEEYTEDVNLIEQAFAGNAVFTAQPTTDRWGTWMSTYVPMHDAAGKIIGVLGVDYDARQWIASILWNRLTILIFASFVAAVLIGSVTVTTALRAEIDLRKASEAQRDKLQQQLLTASRRAGMAEIATGVLHNVGNVLNSVNISVGAITEHLQAVDPRPLERVVTLLHSHQHDLGEFLKNDNVGKRVPEFLGTYFQLLSQEHEAVDRELHGLMKGMEHIKDIVRRQQDYARGSNILSMCDPAELFEEAIRVNAAACAQNGIEIHRVFSVREPVSLDRHKVLQILVNFISNASDALRASKGHRKLTLTLTHAADSHLEFGVADNGVGIAPDHLSSIFQNGFTTKPEGHGFGLHSAANAATEMGGKVTVKSDGLGHGAQFTLNIPVRQAEAKV